LYENPRTLKSLLQPLAGPAHHFEAGKTVFLKQNLWAGCLLGLLLTGCASQPAPQVSRPLPATEREQALDAMTEYKVVAALGVKAPGENVSGTLNWQQHGEYYQASMTNFLGLTVFELETHQQGATVKVDGQTHQAMSAGALLDYLSGWSLPIEEMQLWLKGLPGPSSENLQRDGMGRLTSFTLTDSRDRQWQVSYSDFFPDAKSLPRKMQLQSGDTRLKLVIREWQP
jgi:outer membrane lipoprotein LolB